TLNPGILGDWEEFAIDDDLFDATTPPIEALRSVTIGTGSLAQQVGPTFGAGILRVASVTTISIAPDSAPSGSTATVPSSELESTTSGARVPALPPNADRTWFAAHQSELEARYLGRYVLIARQRVVDSDADVDVLLERFLASYAGGTFYVGFV